MECHASKWKFAGLFGLTLIMVSASYLCTTLPQLKAQIAGWIGVAVFSLGFIAFPMMAIRTGPQVVINDEGIEDRRLKVGIIRWTDIRGLSILSVKSTRFLCVEVAEPERYLSQLPRWKRALASANRALGFPELTISFSGLSPGMDTVRQHLLDRGAAPSDAAPDNANPA